MRAFLSKRIFLLAGMALAAAPVRGGQQRRQALPPAPLPATKAKTKAKTKSAPAAPPAAHAQTKPAPAAPSAAKAQAKPAPAAPIWSAQIGWLRAPGQPWRQSDFLRLASAGVNQAEINLDWGAIEPQRGQFNFALLDRYLAAAAAAHLRLVLIFWESVWDGAGQNPPAWLPQRDHTSDGVATAYPPWWDAPAMRAYFQYIAATLDNVRAAPGFGGLFIAYGWLDAEWGPAPKGSHGVAGYAAADIAEFHRWLPRQYASLNDFNRRWATHYTRWRQAPAAAPGQPLFTLYQRFRRYSVATVYDALSRLARRHTQAPLYYYWGGGLGGAGGIAVLGNDPDLFFRLARRYRATVVLDDADQAGLALLFGNLAQAYRVPLLEEWTPRASGLAGESAGWLAHYGLGLPELHGEDFFLYQALQPGREFARGWPQFTSAHAALAGVKGRVPWQPVALMVPASELGRSAALAPSPGLAQALANFWRGNRVLPALVTDSELQRGVVQSSRFAQIFSLNPAGSSQPALARALPWLKPYAALNPENSTLEIVPVVANGAAWILIANRSAQGYDGSLRLSLPALGLPVKSYAAGIVYPAVVQLKPSTSAKGWLNWPLSVPAGSLEIWRLTPQ